MGDVYKGMTPRDIPNATAAWEKAVEFADDQSPWILNNAGHYFMFNTDRFDFALACLNRSLKIMDFGAARENLGMAMYFKWGDAYMNPGKYKNAKQKPDDPKTIAAKTGVSPESAFSMNAAGSITPWTTIAMIRTGVIKDVDIVVPQSPGTALTSAAWANHFDVVKLLIAKGANVNGRDNDMGNTAIFYAVENQNLEMVRFLFDKGARLNVTNGAKKPLVTHAVENAKRDDIRILTYLLEKGADPSLPDQKGNVLIATAVINGNAQAARLLLQKYRADPNVKLGGSDVSILAIAAASDGPTETVRVLLEGGANPWVQYGSGTDVLTVLARPAIDPKTYPSQKDKFDLIQAARKKVPKPADFGRAYGEK
jgi:hypothetical protein